MKTKIKTSILAIALLASVTGAFASDISNAFTGKRFAAYTWQKYNKNGTPNGSPVTGTQANPFPADCGGAFNVCAVGTPQDESDPIITLRYITQ
jgi:hypothetical protein